MYSDNQQRFLKGDRADGVAAASHPNYSKFEHLLSEGWIPGRKVDNSDQQYAGFRNHIPYLLLLLVFHPLSRRAYLYLQAFRSDSRIAVTGLKPNGSGLSKTQSTDAETRKDQRVVFDLCFAFVYIVALHGSSVLKILVILCANYAIATRLKREHVPIATWIFNIGILFANEICRGYPYATLIGFFTATTNFLGKPNSQDTDANWGSYLDSYGGLIPRWEILFNITVLRLISFNLDFYWSLKPTSSSPLEVRGILFSRRSVSLTLSRRSNLIVPASQKETESTYPRNLKITPFGTILLTFYMLHYILLAPY